MKTKTALVILFAFLVSRDGATAHDANGLDTLEPCGDLALDALAIQFKMNEMLGSLSHGDMNTSGVVTGKTTVV